MSKIAVTLLKFLSSFNFTVTYQSNQDQWIAFIENAASRPLHITTAENFVAGKSDGGIYFKFALLRYVFICCKW